MSISFKIILGFLALLVGSTLPAQVIFESQVDLPGAVALTDIEVLPDGDLFLMGKQVDSLLLVRSTSLGAVVWQQVYSDISVRGWLSYNYKPKLWPTTDGMYSLSILGPTYGLYVLDPANGDLVFSNNDMHARSVAWTTTDSLLQVQGFPGDGILTFGDKYGGLAWTVQPPVITTEGIVIFDQVTRTSLGEIMVLGQRTGSFGSPSSTWHVWLGHYSASGVLVDSVAIGSPVGSPIIKLIGLDRTDDGGFVALAQANVADPIWIRGNAAGEVTSIIEWSLDVDPGQSGINSFQANKTMVLPDGGYRTIGVPLFADTINAEKDRAIFDMDASGLITCVRYFDNDSSEVDPFGDFGMDPLGHTYLCGGSSNYHVYKPNWTWMGVDVLCDMTVQVPETANATTTHISPQPSTGQFTISGLPDGSDYSILLYNSRGQLIMHLQAQTLPLNVNLRDQPEGLFTCVITNSFGQHWQTKLMRMD